MREYLKTESLTNPKSPRYHMKRQFARFLLAAGIMLLSVTSYGQTAINSVPYTITQPGQYFLNKDLSTFASGTAIAINSSNVILDFNGHKLINTLGTIVKAFGVALATNSKPLENVTIKNGTISGFQLGIFLLSGSNPEIETAVHGRFRRRCSTFFNFLPSFRAEVSSRRFVRLSLPGAIPASTATPQSAFPEDRRRRRPSSSAPTSRGPFLRAVSRTAPAPCTVTMPYRPEPPRPRVLPSRNLKSKPSCCALGDRVQPPMGSWTLRRAVGGYLSLPGKGWHTLPTQVPTTMGPATAPPAVSARAHAGSPPPPARRGDFK